MFKLNYLTKEYKAPKCKVLNVAMMPVLVGSFITAVNPVDPVDEEDWGDL